MTWDWPDARLVLGMLRMILLSVFCQLLAGCQAHSPMAPDKPADGSGRNESLEPFAAEHVDFGRYDQVLLASCTVAFRPDWLSQQNDTRRQLSRRLSEQTREALSSETQTLCQAAVTASLQLAPSYRVVPQPDAKTLVLKPRIMNLQVAAPDTQSTVGWSRSYTNESSALTLVLEVTDPESDATVLRFVEPMRSPDTPGLEWSNRVTNRADIQRMLNRGAVRIREQLDQYLTVATNVVPR